MYDPSVPTVPSVFRVCSQSRSRKIAVIPAVPCRAPTHISIRIDGTTGTNIQYQEQGNSGNTILNR